MSYIKGLLKILIFLTSLVCAACTGTTTGNSVPLKTGSTLTASQILEKAINVHLSTATFTVLMTSMSKSSASGFGKLISSTDRTYWKMTTTDKSTSEIIVSSSVLYYRINNDPWNQTTTAAYNWSDILDYSDFQEISLVNVETINGTLAYHLQGTTTRNIPFGDSITKDFWFSVSNSYPVKVDYHLNDKSIYANNIEYQFTFTDWNQMLSINLPVVN